MPNYFKLIQRYAENRLPKTVCTDFDGTITIANKFPAIGEPNHLFIKKLKDLKSSGYKIIVSSCRWSTAIQSEGKAKKQKEEVENWLKENDVPYDELWSDNKPFATIYFDDRSINVKDMDDMDLRIELLRKAKDPQHFEYSCLMLNFPDDISKKVIAWGKKNIPDNWLFDGDGGDLQQQRPQIIHVSSKYGIVCERIDKITEFIEQQKQRGVVPVKCKLGKVSKFANDGKDVIKIEVISEDLSKLHQALGDTFANYEEFDKFEPHVTIAYVRPGEADSILGKKIFGDHEIILNEFDYSIASTGENIIWKI